jgi:hypothetical protein
MPMNESYTSGFSVHHIARLKISASARFLMTYSLSVPYDWHWHRTYIQELLGVGERQLRTILNELREIEVLKVNRIKGKDGKIIGADIIIDITKINMNKAVFNEKLYNYGNKSAPIQEQAQVQEKQQDNHSVQDARCTDSTQIGYTNTNISSVVTTNVQSVHHGEHEFIPPNIETIPEEMKNINQWVFWKAEFLHDKKKPTKIPYMSRNTHAKSNDSNTWQSFSKMEKWQEFGMTGIGFVLSEKDQFTIIDLDNCIIDGQWNDFAKQTVSAFNSYTELSPSGTGLHIIVTGKINKAVKTDKIEIYYTSRYMAMTGCVLVDVPISNRQKLLDTAISRLCKPKKTANTHHPPMNGNGKFTMPDEIFPNGNRNNELAKWAGILNTKNLSENDYYGYLNQINSKCCQPPLNDSEVEAIGKSISRYA